jgi:cytochrome c oxidase cbb3-type subunit III
MAAHRKIDDVTGVETTGHDWDGVTELNKPLPKWWLYTFYATILWAIGYWIVYPAWPGLHDYTHGIWNYSQRAAVDAEVKAAHDAQGAMRAKIEKASLAEIKADPEMSRFARAGGAAAFATNCSPCHGRGAQGAVGYPNLNDDDWLWGGKLDQVYQTIRYGIRAGNKETHDSQMPHFGTDGLLKPEQISDAADYVLSLSGKGENKEAAARGQAIFADNCAACHGPDGKGNQEMGAPNLTDNIWLYGNAKDAVMQSIKTGRGGVMPAWEGRLDPVTVKELAVYVHGLGGGTN